MASVAALWFWWAPWGQLPGVLAEEVRPLRVLVLADAGYQAAHGDWRGRTKGIVEEASQRLAPALGRRLEVSGWMAWPQPARLVRGEQAARWLARVRPAGVELVAGFTAARLPAGGGGGRLELGNAAAFGRQLLVADWGEEVHLAARVFAHEMLHVYGAFHVEDPRSILQPSAEQVPEAWELGVVVEAVLARTRGFDPQRGVESLPKEDLEEVSRLYRAKHHRAERGGADPVAYGYVYRAADELRRRDLVDAERLARRACEWAPECGAAWRQLGEVLLVGERRVEAEEVLTRAVACGAGGVAERVLLAEARWGVGRADEAAALVEEALVWERENWAAHRWAGLCAHVLGDAARYEAERRWLAERSPRAAAYLARRAEQMPAERYRALAGNWRAAREQRVLANSIGMEFVELKGGAARVASAGKTTESSSGGTQKPIRIGRTEVTQEQYAVVMGSNPSRFSRRGGQHPVEQVTWEEAMAFCRRLAERTEERQVGAGYRLPTEAEWLTACGSDDGTGGLRRWLADYAWVADGTHRVGTKAPQGGGLFDVLGNVAEWCADGVPWAGAASVGHVARGGASDDPFGPPRAESRQVVPRDQRSGRIGFRVVREVPAERP